jgi:hypothetical protein
VLSTPPAFVLSQDQTLQTKTRENRSGKNHKRDKKTPHPTNEENQGMAKNKQQTKTTKHTIEFSNNTPTPTAPKARG